MENASDIRPGETPNALRWSLIAGFLAWGCDLGFSYSLTQHTCSTGHLYVLRIVSGVTLLMALSGFVAGFAEYRRLADGADEKGRSVHDRAYFQAELGMIFSLSFATIIIAAAVPRWILPPCS